MNRLNSYWSIKMCTLAFFVFSALYGLQRMPRISFNNLRLSFLKSFKNPRFSWRAVQSPALCPAQKPIASTHNVLPVSKDMKNALPGLASIQAALGLSTPHAHQIVVSPHVSTGFNNYINHRVYFLTSWLNESSAQKLAQDPSLALLLIEEKWSSDAIHFYTAVLNLVHDKTVYEKMIRSFMATVVAQSAAGNFTVHNKEAFIQVWLTFVNHTGIIGDAAREELFYEKNIMTKEYAQFILKNIIPESVHDYTDVRISKIKASIPSYFQIENLQKSLDALD